MTRTAVKMDNERAVITGLIVNTQFCEQIVPIVSRRTFKTHYAKVVSDWAIEHFKEYGEAPQKLIQDIFYQKKHTLGIEEAQSISEFLGSLSKEHSVYTDYNVKYEADKAEEYIKIRNIESVKEELEMAIAEGDPTKGEQAIATFSQVGRPESSGTSILFDTDAILEAFNSQDELAFTWPEGMKEVIPSPSRGDLCAILATTKSGKCVAKGTLVQMADGRMVPIEKVSVGETIVSMDNHHNLIEGKVSNFYENGIKDVYEIITKTGRRIQATTNHQFYSFGTGWKSMQEGMKKGDFIAVPKNVSFFGKNEISEHEATIIAYLIADGGMTQPSATTFTKKDPLIVEDMRRCLEKIGSRLVHLKQESYGYQISGCIGGHSAVNRLLRDYGVERKKSIFKIIPEKIMMADRKSLAVFLNKLFSCDGSVFDYGIEYSTGSKEMAQQIHSLLVRFGIISKLRPKKVGAWTYWVINISDQENVHRFFIEIGFTGEKYKRMQEIMNLKKGRKCGFYTAIPYLHKPHLKKCAIAKGIHTSEREYGCCFDISGKRKINNVSLSVARKLNGVIQDELTEELIGGDILYDKIIDIVYIGEKEVFDIEIENHHNFVANNIVIHNSWHLDFIAETAALQGNKVLFVEMEMRHSQVLRRAYQRMTSSPIVDKTVTIPFFKPCFDPEDKSIKEWDKTYELMEREVEKKGLKIDIENVKQVQDDMRLFYRGGDVKYITYPAYSKTLSYIMAQVDNMIYYENWSPSVVIIDSADLLVPEARSSEIRHQLDDIWKRMRSWAQSRNICIWTVSQGNRASLKGSVTAENIAEDMRKLTHVSLMLGLSRGKEDKAKGIARISSLVQRDGHEVLDEVIVTQCLDIGRFYLEGKPSKQVINL